MGSSELLDLQTAADELGVHYQTAYRWVRSGRLDAQMVDGRYVVGRDKLAALDKARRAPVAPPVPTASRLDRSAERVHDSLLSGDEKTVGQITRKLVDEGSSMLEVITEVLAPSLRRIGEAWRDGHLPIWTEHRASAIVERLLGELAPNPRGRRRGTALVAAMAGDRHSLPTTMAAIVLREDNWHVHHLGSDMPADDLVDFCVVHNVTVAAITVTMTDTSEAAHATAERLRAGGTATIVGRPGLTLAGLLEWAREAAAESRR